MENIKKILKNLSEEDMQIVREYVVDKFKDIITEMAFDRKTVIRKVEDLEDQINLHLVKIIRYKDDLNFEKHLKDVKNWLVQIQKMDVGKKNKKLPEKEYFKLLFTQPFTDATNIKRIQDYEKSDLKDCSKLPRIRSEQETVELLFKIHKEIAKRLAKNNIWDIGEVIFNKIKKEKLWVNS